LAVLAYCGVEGGGCRNW